MSRAFFFDPNPTTVMGAQGSLLAAAIDARYIRLCLLENIGGVYRLAAWLTAPRQGERHLGAELAGACRRLGRRLGRRLWDEEAHAPLLASQDPTRLPPIEQLALTLSPLPPLRVWLAGLSDGYSLAAARQTVTACNVEIVGASILAVTTTSDALGRELLGEQPDALIMAGGYDERTHQSLLPLQHLGALLGNALFSLPPALRPPVFFAGNRWAAPLLQTLMQQAAVEVVVVPNLMPTPGVIRQAPLARALEAYAQQLVQRQDGYRLLEQWHTGPAAVATVESNFVRLAQSWRALHNLTDLHAVYLGERRLHVWSAEGRDGYMLATAALASDPPMPAGWPPPQLVSGPWPDPALPTTVAWWDRHGLAPVVAALGPVAPAAVYQTLTHDLLLPPD